METLYIRRNLVGTMHPRNGYDIWAIKDIEQSLISQTLNYIYILENWNYI